MGIVMVGALFSNDGPYNWFSIGWVVLPLFAGTASYLYSKRF